MAYAVKEIFYTLQGEGFHAGRPAVFCRFSGCNLWSGREADRATAVCQFCDTDFVGTDGLGGGRFTTAQELARNIASYWPASDAGTRFIVCTGGEPLLQLDTELVDALHAERFEIAIETNGTIAVPAGIDWVCVSPKANAPLVVERGDELKVVYPQATSPLQYEALDFRHYFVQPMDGPQAKESVAAAIRFCAEHPRWRLSLQTHKLLGIR
jgi:7-carboxy-7-deazaguanine synthase (Cx14CxxC type)